RIEGLLLGAEEGQVLARHRRTVLREAETDELAAEAVLDEPASLRHDGPQAVAALFLHVPVSRSSNATRTRRGRSSAPRAASSTRARKGGISSGARSSAVKVTERSTGGATTCCAF